jgi:hypothetical protein
VIGKIAIFYEVIFKSVDPTIKQSDNLFVHINEQHQFNPTVVDYLIANNAEKHSNQLQIFL